MQETPNFNNYRSQYQGADKGTVLDSREIITGADRKFLESVYSRLDLYFDNQDFRNLIPVQKRQFIEDNFIAMIISSLANIANWQRDGMTTILGSNLQNIVINISDQIVSYDQQVSGYHNIFLADNEPLGKRIQEINNLKQSAEQEAEVFNQIVSGTKEQVYSRKSEFDQNIASMEASFAAEIESQKQKGEQTLDSVRSVLSKARLLAGISGGHKLGNYYQKLANGRTIDENDEFINERETNFNKVLSAYNPKKLAIYTTIIFVAAYLISLYLINNPVKFGIWEGLFVIYTFSAVFLLGLSYAIIKGLKAFNRRYKGGHARLAILWMIGAVVTTIFTAVYSGILVHDLSSNGEITWEEIIPKIIVLLAPAYLIRLCIQNYRANAHLEVQYMHRATIVSIAESYSDATALEDPIERADSDLVKLSVEARMAILTDAAKIMFAQSESGFITQKEGAGSNGDNPMDTLRNNITIGKS